MLVSGVQQSDSVQHIHVSILFQILFPFRLLQNIEQSSLCYTVGPCWLSILNITVYTCQSQYFESCHTVVCIHNSLLGIAEWYPTVEDNTMYLSTHMLKDT